MDKDNITHPYAIAVCSARIDKSRPGELQLFPAGEFRAADGRPAGKPWRMDEAVAGRLIAAARQRVNPYVLDYEHNTLTSQQTGQPAPRAGEFNTLEWREGNGLYAVNIAYTRRAEEFISNDEYGWASPVFTWDPKTGEVLTLFHAALTNDPGLHGMAPAVLAALSNSYNQNQGVKIVDELLERLCYMLNLPLTTTKEEMIAQLDKIKTMMGLRRNRPP
jgi:phage I-like protein